MKLLLALACLVTGFRGAAVHPVGTLDARAPTTACGSNEVVKVADFEISNYWVEGSRGSQCTTVLWSNDSAVSWIANWSWASESASLVSSSTAHFTALDWPRISNFESIPISWLWSYQFVKGIKANVAYDVVGFAEGAAAINWNLQVWLGSYGVLKPLGSEAGVAHLRNVTYDVFTDETFGWKTHTFVARSPQTNFTSDLVDFFGWTVDNLGISTDSFIYTMQGGTNVYQGVGATFISSRFSLEAKYRTTPSAPPLPSQTAAPVCAPQWGQCGGQGWSGPRCCPPGNSCVYQNQYHSQCLLD